MSKLHDTRTREERALGRRQRYVHSGFDPIWKLHNYAAPPRLHRNPAPMEFRKPKGLKPVKGGRWGVRKLACDTPNGWQWEAYCKGTMKGASGRFPTHKLAIEHAQRMATLARMVRK